MLYLDLVIGYLLQYIVLPDINEPGALCTSQCCYHFDCWLGARCEGDKFLALFERACKIIGVDSVLCELYHREIFCFGSR